MSFCISLWNVIQIGPPSAGKNDVMSIFKMADLSYLGFWGSNNGFLEKPNYITSYRSSVDTIPLNCIVFEKIAFFVVWQQTDRQTNRRTDGQHRCTKPRQRERLNKYILEYCCCNRYWFLSLLIQSVTVGQVFGTCHRTFLLYWNEYTYVSLLPVLE